MFSYFDLVSFKRSISVRDYILLFFSTIFFGATIWKRINNWRRKANLLEAFPGPKSYWLLGSIFPEIYLLLINPARHVLDVMAKFVKDYGSVYRVWLFNTPKVVVADAEIAIELYNNGSIDNKSSEMVNAAKAVGGEGLVALPLQVHVHRRKQWASYFRRRRIEDSVEFFRDGAIRLCTELEAYGNSGKAFDMVEFTVECTFRAICHSAFGKQYMEMIPESLGKSYMHDIHTVSVNMTRRIFRPWLSNDFIYFHGTREGRETLKCVQRAYLLMKNAIHERKRRNEMDVSSEVHTSSRRADDHESFLDLMLDLVNVGKITEEEVIQELNVFVASGYDTSGIAICYCLYFLSLYPEHQDRIVEELCGIIPPGKRDSIESYNISPISIKNMKYLELCIKETLRLYPVAPITLRSTTRDVKLSDGRIIPKDTDVYVLLNLIQRDPKYFPEPEKYIPERHLKANPAFMPFALGTRNCIGQVLAMYEMKVVLTYLLMRYKWETIEKEGFKPILLALQVPENGLHFKITKRTFENNL